MKKITRNTFYLLLIFMVIFYDIFTEMKNHKLVSENEKINIELNDSKLELEILNSELENCQLNFVNLECLYGIIESENKRLSIINVNVSAYSASKDECDNDPHITSLLQRPISGKTCAVSRDLLYLLNKKIYIYQLGVFLVNDLMNKRYTKSIDLFLGSKKQALKFGRKKDIKIVVLCK